MALSRLPRAVVGSLGFLTRLPLGGERDWEAFRRTPAAFPLAGYAVGAALAVPFLLPLPPATTAAAYLVAVYGLTGVTHADGLADLADAAAVHRPSADGGSARERRREALGDPRVGVGGALAVAVGVAALALAALALAASRGADAALRAAGTVVAAEVAAKAGMGLLASVGSPAHEGLGSAVVAENAPRDLAGVALAAAPAVLLAGPARARAGALLAVVLAGTAVALGVRRWATRRLGGVSGDAFGAANELGRAAALHAGVVAWSLA